MFLIIIQVNWKKQIHCKNNTLQETILTVEQLGC